MEIFHFPQCEQELFYHYWDRLHAYLAQCASCGCLYEKWEVLHVVDEGVNCETRALFEHWDFYARNVEEAWDFLDWLLGILMNLKLVVLILVPHPLASLIMLLLSVKFIIVLIMKVIIVLVIFVMIVLLNCLV